MDKQQLCEFLVTAKKATYASGDSAQKIVEADQSTTLVFEEGGLKYHDNYFGGEPFGGREVVFSNGQPVYLMTYYGRVDASISDFGPTYQFLQEALALIPVENPYRGPNKYERDDLVYVNEFVGEVHNFSGEEKIIQAGKEIYSAKYIGGFVNQKND